MLHDVPPLTLAERIDRDEGLCKAELKRWKGWSDKTIDRYCQRGMPVTVREGMRDIFVPSRVDRWLKDGTLPPHRGPGRPRRVTVR
jgi:hypothetical protein